MNQLDEFDLMKNGSVTTQKAQLPRRSMRDQAGRHTGRKISHHPREWDGMDRSTLHEVILRRRKREERKKKMEDASQPLRREYERSRTEE